MIREGKYFFRKGNHKDKPLRSWNDGKDLPTFVLEFKGKQVGAAQKMGSENHLIMIKMFEKNIGHGTKFIQLWEEYAKKEGFSEICISHVASDRLEHILENKLDFSLIENDNAIEKTYIKKLS